MSIKPATTTMTFNKSMTDQLSNLDKTRIRIVKHPASGRILVQFTLDESYQRMSSYTSKSGYQITVSQSKLERLGLEPGRYHLTPLNREGGGWYCLRRLEFDEPNIRFTSPVVTVNNSCRLRKVA